LSFGVKVEVRFYIFLMHIMWCVKITVTVQRFRQGSSWRGNCSSHPYYADKPQCQEPWKGWIYSTNNFTNSDVPKDTNDVNVFCSCLFIWQVVMM